MSETMMLSSLAVVLGTKQVLVKGDHTPWSCGFGVSPRWSKIHVGGIDNSPL
jgi:propanediol dehydratase large subunit